MAKSKPGPRKGTRHKDIPRSPLAERLSRARRAKGLTQEQLGQRVGLTQRMVAHYEADSKAMTVASLQKIADVLGVSVAYLTGGTKVAAGLEEEPLKPSLKKRIETLRRLPPADQQAIFRIIDNAAQKNGMT